MHLGMTSSQSAIFERYPSYSGALAATEAEGGDGWTGGQVEINRQRLAHIFTGRDWRWRFDLWGSPGKNSRITPKQVLTSSSSPSSSTTVGWYWGSLGKFPAGSSTRNSSKSLNCSYGCIWLLVWGCLMVPDLVVLSSGDMSWHFALKYGIIQTQKKVPICEISPILWKL